MVQVAERERTQADESDEQMGTTSASRLLDLSEGSVRRLAREGTLPHIQTPLGRLYSRRELERWAAENGR